jgi:hypothetical protein
LIALVGRRFAGRVCVRKFFWSLSRHIGSCGVVSG